MRGGLPEGAENSAYYLPSLVEVSDVDTPIIQQEVFRPVATFEVFDTEADAVQRANATEYGLAASVWSRDIDRPLRVGRELRAGTVWTNTWAIVVDQFEEGGFGQSGLAGSTACVGWRSSRRIRPTPRSSAEYPRAPRLGVPA